MYQNLSNYRIIERNPGSLKKTFEDTLCSINCKITVFGKMGVFLDYEVVSRNGI